jgi:type IV pilus assembly protein PilB
VCANPEPVDGQSARLLAEALGSAPSSVLRGKGCVACNNTGFKGRQAIYEVMPLSDELREAIARGAPTVALRTIAQGQGMRTLRQVAMEKAVEGVTTLDEALRVTGE